MPDTNKPRTKRKKQHDMRGASFVRLATRLRNLSQSYEKIPSTEASKWIIAEVLDVIADCIEAEGKATRAMR